MLKPVTTNGHDAKSDGKQGKKKKKSKGTMSLEEFNQLPPEQPKGSDSGKGPIGDK